MQAPFLNVHYASFADAEQQVKAYAASCGFAVKRAETRSSKTSTIGSMYVWTLIRLILGNIYLFGGKFVKCIPNRFCKTSESW